MENDSSDFGSNCGHPLYCSKGPFFAFTLFSTIFDIFMCKKVPHCTKFSSVKFSDFMCLPFPSPRCPRIIAHLSAYHMINLSLPRYRPLPPSGASFLNLLWHLGSERMISLFHAVLVQKPICIHSLHLAELTPAVEAVAGKIFSAENDYTIVYTCIELL